MPKNAGRKRPIGFGEQMQEYYVREHRYPSANGRDTVYAKLYLPQGQPRGLVQISHGMAEHIGRYDEFMRYLCVQGYVVVGNDHIGHGHTAANSSWLGHLAHQKGFDCLVTDLHQLSQYVRGLYPGLPQVLLGHSMGSFAARLYASRYGKELAGLVLSGTGGGNHLLPWAVLIKRMAGSRGGNKPSRLLDKLAFGGFNRGIRKPKTPYDWLSRDAAAVASYITDPYCGFVFSASAFGDLFTGIYWANHRAWYLAVPKALPILLLSGDQDPVGDYGKGVRKVYEGLRRAGVQDVRLKLYPAGRHEMLNELNRQQVYEEIGGFVQEVFAHPVQQPSGPPHDLA